MKIAVFVDTFPRLSETFILSQVLYFRRQGHAVTVFCENADEAFRHRPEDADLLAEVCVRRWPGAGWRNSALRPGILRRLLGQRKDRAALAGMTCFLPISAGRVRASPTSARREPTCRRW